MSAVYPTIARFKEYAVPQPWGALVVVAETPEYTGKVLIREPDGPRAGLQYHPTRSESFYLYEGEVDVYFVKPDGLLCRVHMTPGMSFYIPAGAIHSVQTCGRSVMFETSRPLRDGEVPRVNVERNYDITQAIEVDPVTLESLAVADGR